MWTLIILIITGSLLSQDFKNISIQMTNKDACINAAKDTLKDTNGGAICISSDTGEVIRIKK